jgi:hypothetical protein
MNAGSSHSWPDAVHWILWGILVALFLAWPLTHLEAYAHNNDEGLYVQRAALANAGCPLYHEILFNKPPLMIWILRLAFYLGGQTLTTARMACLSICLMGFVAGAVVVRQLWGRWAALISACLLLGLPEMPVRAHGVTSDLPAMTLALAALGAALLFRRNGRRLWIALSGAAYTGALLINLLLVYVALPLVLILFLPDLGKTVDGRTSRRTGWLDLVLFGSISVGLGASVLAVIDRQAFFTWVIKSNYIAARSGVTLESEGMIAYLVDRWTLVWLALVGVVILLRVPRERHRLAVVLAWFLSTVIVFLIWSPVWGHYMLFLAFPMAAAAGGGLARLGDGFIRTWRDARRMIPRHGLLLALALAGIVAFCGERCVEKMPHPEGGLDWSAHQLAAMEFLRAATPPDGYVVTDDPLLAFVAERMVPPLLTEATFRQILLGNLTTEDVVRCMLCRRTQAVLFATGRLVRLQNLERWVAEIAVEKQTFGLARAYRLDIPEVPPNQMNAPFGREIILEGFQISNEALAPGDVLTVTLFWRAASPVLVDYSAHVSLVDEAGHTAGECYMPTLMGALRTSLWPEDVLLLDPHRVTIDVNAPPGRYRLRAALCVSPEACVPTFQNDTRRWPEDRVVLAELDIGE